MRKIGNLRFYSEVRKKRKTIQSVLAMVVLDFRCAKIGYSEIGLNFNNNSCFKKKKILSIFLEWVEKLNNTLIHVILAER